MRREVKGHGPRGDLDDDEDLEKPLENEIRDWPVEPSRIECPLPLVRDSAPDPRLWEELIANEHLRSWMMVRREHPGVSWSDFETLADCNFVDWRELYGSSGKTTRKTAWFVAGTCRCQYRYGSENVDPVHMPDWFLEMASRWLGDICGTNLPNSANLNYYEDGAHAVNWHSDDEKLFGGRHGDCTIFSVTLGSSRLFNAALRLGSRESKLVPDRQSLCSVDLGHGDICTMEGYFQKHYIHKISRCIKNRAKPRINVTFRYITSHAPECPLNSVTAATLAAKAEKTQMALQKQEELKAQEAREKDKEIVREMLEAQRQGKKKLKELKLQLAELEILKDKAWDELTDDDEERLENEIELRAEIAELEKISQ